MRLIFGSLLVLCLGSLALSLAACGKSDDKSNISVDKDGNCTTAFVDDRNAVANAYNSMRTLGTRESHAAFLAACDNFVARHNGVQCKAISQQTGQITTANANDIAQNCNLFRR